MNGARWLARLLVLMAGTAAFVTGIAAQGRGSVAAPSRQALDTTPPGAYYGVTEYQAARQKVEQLIPAEGIAIYIISDMEGLAGVVNNAREMLPGRGNSPDHQRFREEETDEINAVIAGARAGGATAFVVNEGHGGDNFHNVIPERLDPIVMTTGLSPRMNAMMIIGAHSNAGSNGIIAHSYAFDSFTVNGHPLNETGIAAFIGGEMGVPLILAAGDDALTSETRDMLGPIETVTVKTALGRAAGASLSFPRAHAELREAALRAVDRLRRGDLKPLRFATPYQIRYCIRASFTPEVFALMARLPGIRPDPATGPRCFGMETSSAEAVGNLLNEIEWSALKP
jgi:D-amino peptidase